MRLELSLSSEISIRQEQSIDFPVVIENIKAHFKDDESGDVRNLKELLRTIPQRQNGRLAYVIGGGWAVEIITGIARNHGNINVLVVDPGRTTLESNRCLDYLGVQYLEDALRRALVKKDILKSNWRRGRQGVYVPSREFMIGTKLLPRTAVEGNRDKDIADVVQLLAVAPDVRRLTKVFNALPYVRNGESVASIVYGAAGVKHNQEKILRLLNEVLREQLAVFDKKQSISREKDESGDILGVELLSSDFESLKKYFQKEATAENYRSWLAGNRTKLVNPSGRIYHPNHPLNEPVFVDIKGYKNVFLDSDGYEALQRESARFPGEEFAVSYFSEGDSFLLSVWNPKGKLVYEKWKK